MRCILVLACALTLAFPLGAPIPVRAAGFTVNSPIDAPDANPGDGICATAAGFCSLRAAIQEANATPAPDTITVPPGTYVLSVAGRGEDLAATGDLDIRGPLSIIGAGPASTIIDGSAADRVFHIIGPIGVQMSGFTLRNGSVPRPADISADGGGGAIYVVGGGSLTLTNVAVSGNNATSGAIAIDDGGSLTMTGSTINSNSSGFGGGIFNNGSVMLSSTMITGNSADASGGGIYHRQGSLSITNSTISGNSAASGSIGGGGILVAASASATITASTLSGNTARTNGGGIHGRGTLSLVNATISGNSAHRSGGGLYVGGGSTTLSNVTLANNAADVQGSSLMLGGGSAQARSSILASSSGGANCVGLISSLGYNLDSSQTCGLSGPGDLVGVNPQLGPLQNNGGTTSTQALPPTSPAIDAGNPAAPGSSGACEAVDQRGQRRPTDGNGDGSARCDIGAFEAAAATVPVGPFPVVANPPLPTPFSGGTLPTTPTATPPSSIGAPPTPVRAPATAPTPVRPATSAPPLDEPAGPTDWVLVTAQTETLSVDDDPLGVIEPGEWLAVIAEEDGWLLVASEPTTPFWIEDDERVEVHRS
jgi:CSLREA domain-containing protein